MSSSEVDRLSELPESLISRILSFLPTRTAFKTSFVSKTWKLHWTKVTALDFNVNMWPKTSDFQEFVNRVLNNHSGESINKFRLRSSEACYMLTWAEAALAQNVKVLDLHVYQRYHDHQFGFEDTSDSEVFSLPNSLYTHRTLEILKLRGNFRVTLVPNVCLPKLTVLELEEVIYESDECVGNLISGSPLVQSLSVRKPSACAISSPILKHLRIYTENSFIDNFKVEGEIDAPALESLFVGCDDSSVEVSILGQTSASFRLRCIGKSCLRFLKLFENTMMILKKATKNRFPGSLERATINFNHIEWRCLMDLLDRCINLQVLEISCFSSIFHGIDWDDHVPVPKCVSSTLKEVKFGTFRHTEDEKNMLNWIQEHGLVLQRVEMRRFNPPKSTTYAGLEILYS